jgi:hypothetical protein
MYPYISMLLYNKYWMYGKRKHKCSCQVWNHQHLITFYQMMADNNLQASAVAAKKAWGAGYTRMEDYFVCKAFIAASEDPFVGKQMPEKFVPSEVFFCYN